MHYGKAVLIDTKYPCDGENYTFSFKLIGRHCRWDGDRGPGGYTFIGEKSWMAGPVADLDATVAWMTQTPSFLPALSRARPLFSLHHFLPGAFHRLVTVCCSPNLFSTRLPITSRALSVRFPSIDIDSTRAQVTVFQSRNPALYYGVHYGTLI